MISSPFIPVFSALFVVLACIPTLSNLNKDGDYFSCAILTIGALFTGFIIVPWIGWMILNSFNFIFGLAEKSRSKSR